jgi:hypothetical protein
MSISYNTSGATSDKDKKKKSLEYRALLALRIDANNRIAKAFEELDQNRISGMPPVPAPYRSAEDEINDLVLQRDMAFKTLKTVMKEGDASIATQQLQATNELPEFNRFSSQFLSEIKSMSNITPAIFSALWDRYKIKLAGTIQAGTPTGIIIGAEKGEYDAKLQDIEDAISSLVPPPTAVPTPSSALEKRIYDLCGADVKTLDGEFEVAYKSAFKSSPRDGDDINIPNQDATADEKFQLSADSYKGEPTWRLIPYTTKGKLSTAKPLYWPVVNTAKIRFIITLEEGRSLNLGYKWTGDATKVADIVYPTKGTVKSGTGVITKQAIVSGKKEYSKKGGHYNEPNFGKYYISENALKQGYLLLRHVSGPPTAFTKSPILISSKLQQILKNIIYACNKHAGPRINSQYRRLQFNEAKYQELSDDEKRLFDDLLTFSKLDRQNGVEFYKHKKYNDADNEKDIERYKVLTGQIGAGNNNADIVKELKSLLFKMASNGTINKRDYYKTIHMLLLV